MLSYIKHSTTVRIRMRSSVVVFLMPLNQHLVRFWEWLAQFQNYECRLFASLAMCSIWKKYNGLKIVIHGPCQARETGEWWQRCLRCRDWFAYLYSMACGLEKAHIRIEDKNRPCDILVVIKPMLGFYSSPFIQLPEGQGGLVTGRRCVLHFPCLSLHGVYNVKWKGVCI